MEENNMNRTYEIVGGIVVLVIVIILCVWLLVRHNEGAMMGSMATSTSETATSTASTTTSAMAVPKSPMEVVSGDMVSANDQSAGNSVMISSVTLTQRGWVAVKNSKGTILGAALFPAGTHTNVTVPLLRPTVAGQMYEAILYVDAGQKVFSLHTDTLVMSSDGAMVSAGFNAR